MPIQDGNYVAPEWVNSQPPAINASELNDISKTLENDWRREQVLTPNTAQVFGFDGNATPDQVFSKIAQQFGKTLNVTVTLDGSPISGVTVQGITTEDGGACVTNEDGKTSGVCATSSTTITAVSIWIDVDSKSQVVDTSKVETNATLAMTSKSSGKIKITASKTFKFSPSRKSIHGFAVGGGGGGSAAVTYYANPEYTFYNNIAVAAGSGSGHFNTFTFNPNGENIKVTIGKGGDGVAISNDTGYESGNRGGDTIVAVTGGSTYTALGGSAGSCKEYSGSTSEVLCNGGSGGSGGGGAMFYDYTGEGYIKGAAGGTNGANGADASYDSSSGTASGGRGDGVGKGTFDGETYGAGSGGAVVILPGGSGSKVSASGISVADKNATSASNGSNYGDAGGSVASAVRSGTVKSGNGKQGIVIFKWTT